MILTYSPTTSPIRDGGGGIFYPLSRTFRGFPSNIFLLDHKRQKTLKMPVRMVSWSDGQFFLRPYF